MTMRGITGEVEGCSEEGRVEAQMERGILLTWSCSAARRSQSFARSGIVIANIRRSSPLRRHKVHDWWLWRCLWSGVMLGRCARMSDDEVASKQRAKALGEKQRIDEAMMIGLGRFNEHWNGARE